jgi:hypothetical protein
MPFPLGPQTGRSCRRAAASNLSSSARPAAISPKPAPYTTAPPHPRAPASSTTAGTPAAGIATTTASGGEGQSASVGKHSNQWADVRPGFTPETCPGNPRGPQVQERLPRTRPGPLRRADDRDRPRVQQPSEVRQCSVRSTPRRSSARATISRWISLVPSQIRSTRSSRRKRSATFVRM